MHLLNPAPFGRILPAMVTPMKADGTVDFEAAQSLAKQLVADGADGLVVNGTTGESPVTHMEEKVELVRAVKEVVDVPVISGAGSNDTAHTVRMVEQTQEAGADAVLVVMPYYSRPSQDGVVGHYKAVDSVAERPIIVYDVPGRTGLKVRVETYDRLAELEHVKAVKDATGDLAAAVEKQQRTGLARDAPGLRHRPTPGTAVPVADANGLGGHGRAVADNVVSVTQTETKKQKTNREWHKNNKRRTIHAGPVPVARRAAADPRIATPATPARSRARPPLPSRTTS